MSDEKLGRQVHEAARLLCGALNEAGEAGLVLSVKFEPYSASHCGNRVLKTGNWRPTISIRRETYIDN